MDDPYKRQRVKPQNGAVGGAPVVNDVVAPKLRRDAAMYAPITNHFSPSAAAAQLVDSRLAKSGQPLPSQMNPMAQRVPSAADPAMPPPAARITLAMPPPAAKLTRAPGPGMAERIGQGLESAAPVFGGAANQAAQETGGGIIARGVRGARTGILTGLAGIEAATRGAGAALGYTAGEVGTGLGYAQAAPAATIATPPAAAAPMPTGARRTGGRPDLRQAPTVAAAPAPGAPQQPAQPTAQPLTRPGANAAAPGQVGLSEKTQQPLPGAPVVGADGSVQYDQAFMTRNPQLIDQYQKQNVVQTVVPGAGVAQSMATGGNMQAGSLSRPPPQGFTAADRAAQLDGLNRLGRSNTEGKVRDAIAQAAARGDADAVAKLTGAANGLAATPLEPLKRSMNNADAAAGNDAARLAMEQDAARMGAEQQGLQTQQQQIQLKQAQQMQVLSEQLMSGTPEQKQAAAASLAALQGAKPGQPIKLKQSYDTGRVDFDKNPIMADYEILMSQDGKVLYDPMAQGAQQKRPVGQMQEEKTGKIYDVYADGTRQEVQQ